VAAIRDALAALVGAIKLAGGEDVAVLKKASRSTDQPLGIRLSAWLKMGRVPNRVWPGNADELKEDDALREALLAAVANSPADGPRIQATSVTVDQEFARRWGALLNITTSPADVTVALELRERYSFLDAGKLSTPAKWNAQLYELRAMLARPRDRTSAERVRVLVDTLLRTTRELTPTLAIQPQVARLTAQLQEWKGGSAPVDFGQLGPMSSEARALVGVAIRWKVNAEDDGSVVVYTGLPAYPAAQEEITLVFRKVNAQSNASGFYLCTGETTVATFNDVLVAAGRWPEVKRRNLLGDVDARGADRRAGPRAWGWSSRHDGGITNTLAWLSKDWLPDAADHYPETLGSDLNRTALRGPAGASFETVNPSRRQPMQQVPAEAAAYFAPLVGCRLPTPDEWKTAYAASGKGIAGANLRDATWKLQYEHMAKTWSQPAYRPDAGMFVPAGEARTAEVWKTDDGAEYNDGTLWFREAAAPTTLEARDFQNLAGNVAEFVRDREGKFYVIGASALSPPTRPIDKALPLDPRDATRGFSDVGFRLAFTAPPSPVDRLTTAMPEAGWWLVAERGK
jgi:hypothetical protein